MPSFRVQTGLRLTEEALEKIAAIAKREKRSLNAQIELVIEKFIRQYEVENGFAEDQE